MVQSGYHHGGGRYSARAAATRSRRREAAGEDAAYPAGRATVQAGLRSYALSKAEQKCFAHCAPEYREARNFVLGKWDADTTRFLPEEECVDAAAPGREGSVRDAYRFLHRHGAINFGLLRGDPRVPLPPGLAARVEAAAAAAGAGGPPQPSDERLGEVLYDVMGEVDMSATTEKMLRRQVGERLGVDVGGRKAHIRQLVNEWLSAGGPPAWYKQRRNEAARRRRQEAAARRWRVAVVGAGPAGLTAALHLKRHGVEVLVLEARDRVGGRVHSYAAGGLTAPVDLGASIITGTEPDVEKGLRSDPSAILCKQLGIKLHQLGERLPLLDTATGLPVPQQLDREVDGLRDELMDDVTDALDDMGQEAAEALSYGQALSAAVRKRQAAADAAAAARAAAAAEPAAAEPAAAEPAAAAAPQPADPELESAVAMLVEPSAAAPPLLAAPGDELGLGGDLLLDGAAQPEADDFMASLLASPSPKRLAAPPPAEPAGEGAAPEAARPGDEDGGAAAAQAAEPSAAGAPAEPAPAADGAAPESAGQAAQAPVPGEPQGLSGAAAAPAGGSQAGSEGGEGGGGAPPPPITADQRRLLHWHWANLEYGCSARLDEISALHWNQDESAGGFGGPHCMVVGGYGAAFEAVAEALGDGLLLGEPVVEVRDARSGPGVEVATAGGAVHACDAVLVCVPLGVLKAGALRFDPELPAWKREAVDRLGFGDLNKVVLEFPSVFWDDSVDYFGVAGEPTVEERGRCFMFWNFHRFSGANTLAALVSGASARAAEEQAPEALRDACLAVLRRVHPGAEVPEPSAFTVTKWASEPYTRGSYSYVAVGASGQHYDTLARPVGRRLLFAGEHTAREHPDTVGGAMLSGLREAARVLETMEEEEEGQAGRVAARDGGAELDKMPSLGSLGRKRKSSAGESLADQRDDSSEREVEDEEDWGGAKGHKSPAHKRPRSANKPDGGEAAPEAGASAIWRYIRASEIGREMDWADEEGEAERQAVRAREKQQQKKRKRRGDDEVASEDDLEKKLERDLAVALGKERQWVSEEQLRAQRSSGKEIARAAMLAAAGDAAPLRELLQRTQPGGRHFVLMQLRQADQQVWEAMAADDGCVAAVSAWLGASVGEGGEGHVVDAALRLLRLLPLESDALQRAGLPQLLRSRVATHSDPDLRKLAQEVLRAWTPPEAAEAPAGGARNGVRPASAGAGGGAPRPASRQAPPAPPAPPSAADLEAYLDGQRRAELAELERAAAAAAAEAAAAEAALAAAHEPALDAAPSKIRSFKYNDRHNRQSGTKLERVPHADRRDASSRDAGHGGGITDSATKRQVAKYVEAQLKPLFEAQAITKDEFKWAARKAVAKVLKQSSVAPGEEFLTKKKRGDIKALVAKYVERRGELMSADQRGRPSL